MTKMKYNRKSSFSQIGNVPKTKSIHSIALYSPKDGTILHMHHVMTMEGCEPRNEADAEEEAVSFAKKLGHDIENLKVLHVPDTVNPFTRYRIDLTKLEFVELPKPSIAASGFPSKS